MPSGSNIRTTRNRGASVTVGSHPEPLWVTLSGSWRARAAPVHLLRAAPEPPERVLRAALELPGQEPLEQLSPPPGRERDVSPIADAALIRPERRHGDGLIIDDAERQPEQQAEPVRARVHLEHIEGDGEHPERSGRGLDPLPR